MFTTLFLIFYLPYCSQQRSPPEFKNLISVRELSASAGYPASNYEVITEDGYSLWLFRLGNNTGPPVLLQHGLLVAADQWITRGPGKDLAFILLKRGFDVWLSSVRGTVFSEYSRQYPKTDPRYFDFSMDEIGYYDMPAQIDKILQLRKLDNIFYVGHSMGTAVMLMMCSSRPEYNAKIRLAALLSPIAYLRPRKDLTTAYRLLVENNRFLMKGLDVTGLQEIFPRTEANIRTVRTLCTGDVPTRPFCLDLLGALSGENRYNLNQKELDFFFPYMGAGFGVKVWYHIAQFITSDKFRRYDYGPTENLRRYGNSSPPVYPLDRVTSPVALYWSYGDLVTSELSVLRTGSELGNLEKVQVVPDPLFSHVDMYIGENAPFILYPDILQLFVEYTQDGELPTGEE